MLVLLAGSNTLVQTIVEDSKRGRVMAFFIMAFLGVMPLGSLMAGSLAETRLGAPGTVALGGALCIAGSLLFRRKLPAICRETCPVQAFPGILPEVARGLEAAVGRSEPKS